MHLKEHRICIYIEAKTHKIFDVTETWIPPRKTSLKCVFDINFLINDVGVGNILRANYNCLQLIICLYNIKFEVLSTIKYHLNQDRNWHNDVKIDWYTCLEILMQCIKYVTVV